MSIISSIADAIVGTIPKSPTTTPPAVIERRIMEARGRLQELKRQHGMACLDALDSGDTTTLDKLAADVEREERDLARLELALRAAHERALASTRAENTALRASRTHSATMHARSAEKAGQELSDALANAGAAYHKLLHSSAKMRVSSPDPLPLGSLTEPAILARLVQGEMHRLTWRTKTGGIPGSQPPSLQTREKPDAIKTLVDQLRQAHDRAIGVLKGEIASDRTPNDAPVVGYPLAPFVGGEFLQTADERQHSRVLKIGRGFFEGPRPRIIKLKTKHAHAFGKINAFPEIVHQTRASTPNKRVHLRQSTPRQFSALCLRADKVVAGNGALKDAGNRVHGGHLRGLKFAGDAMHSGVTYAKLCGNPPLALATSGQRSTDGVVSLLRQRRPADGPPRLGSLLTCASDARAHPSDDHAPLEFGEYAEHLEHGFARWRAGIEPLLQKELY
jgi:hypothetical protein